MERPLHQPRGAAKAPPGATQTAGLRLTLKGFKDVRRRDGHLFVDENEFSKMKMSCLSCLRSKMLK